MVSGVLRVNAGRANPARAIATPWPIADTWDFSQVCQRRDPRAGPEPRQPPCAPARTQMKAVKLLRIAALVAIPYLSSVACGDDDDDVLPGIDVTWDAAQPDAAADGAWPGTCDPVRQDCPAGQQCTGGCNVVGVMAKVFTCAVPSRDATATHGQDCGAGCARGHDCFLVPAAAGGTRSVCRKTATSTRTAQRPAASTDWSVAPPTSTRSDVSARSRNHARTSSNRPSPRRGIGAAHQAAGDDRIEFGGVVAERQIRWAACAHSGRPTTCEDLHTDVSRETELGWKGHRVSSGSSNMKIAVLTFEGFNEIDSFVASHILNRVKRAGWKAEITGPAESVQSERHSRGGPTSD